MTDPAPLLTDAELAALRAPIETARTLPRRAFTSEEYFDRERRRIAIVETVPARWAWGRGLKR